MCLELDLSSSELYWASHTIGAHNRSLVAQSVRNCLESLFEMVG